MKMEGIIFDLDGVLVDSMPTHVRAWQAAFESVAGVKVTEREIYLLEGMRGMELIMKIFGQKGKDNSLAKEVQDEKNRVFRSIRRSDPFDGAAKMLDLISRPKAVVSGSAKADVEAILGEASGKSKFSAIIMADDVKVGKPNPTAFLEAARQLKVSAQKAVVVENAPLGAVAARKAGMGCHIALNSTPLLRDDFRSTIQDNRIFRTTSSFSDFLVGMCA
jgi:HAD superfamily hydrolase (TIGR01509 family)